MASKIIRTGNTEITVGYILYLQALGFHFDNGLIYFWTDYMRTAGYFEAENDQSSFTELMKVFIKNYLDSLKGADLFIMSLSLNKLNELNSEHVDSYLNSLSANSIKFQNTVGHDPINSISDNKRVFCISPFSDLMIKQFMSGNLSKIRPNFKPTVIGGFKFPYLYDSKEYKSSNEALDSIFNHLKEYVVDFDVILLSCGVYGGRLSMLLHELGKDVCYAGGDMQIFFGIMGSRWKNSIGTQEDYLSKKDFGVNEIPSEYVYVDAAKIENSCYW